VELARMSRYEVVSAEEIQTMMGIQSMKATEHCDDLACAAEIAAALASDFVITGNVGRLAGKLSITLTLYDSKRMAVVRHAQHDVPDNEALYTAAIIEALRELLGDDTTLPASNTPTHTQPASNAPAQPSTTPPAVLQVKARDTNRPAASAVRPSPAASSDLTVWGNLAFWSGVGLAGFGGLSAILAVSAASDYRTGTDPSAEDRIRSWTGVMWAGLGAGAALCATGVTLWLLDSSAAEHSASAGGFVVSPLLSKDGVGVTVGGAW
jgi:hypothetical protein